ncbi:MAG: chemotaxis protein CheW [Chloroflexota bacterium]
MSVNSNTRQAILTFRLADQYYALPIENVLEVVAMMTISKIPNAPDAIIGMVNRHGEALAMLDLRLVFGLYASPPDVSTLFIVAQGEAETYRVGLLVDEILQVRYVVSADIQVAKGIGQYINNIIHVDDTLYQQVTLNAIATDYLDNVQPSTDM